MKRLQDSVAHSDTLIIPNDLQHLKRVGRLTPLAAALGGLLKIKPILKLDEGSQGKIDVFDKVRTMSKAMSKAVTTFQETKLDDAYTLTVLHSGSRRGRVKAEKTLMEVSFSWNGSLFWAHYAVISCHTG